MNISALAIALITSIFSYERKSHFDIAFVGDVSFAGRRDAPSELFAAARSLLSAPDLTVANIEGLLLTDGAPRYREARLNISADPRWAASLPGSGIDLLTTANNHSWDAGSRGARAHRLTLTATGLPVLGVGPDLATALTPHRVTTSIGCLAIIAVTLKSNRSPDLRPPQEAVAFVALPGEPPRPGQAPFSGLTDLIRDERAAGCAPIVAVHWGREGLLEPPRAVRAVGRRLIAAGAALLVGHHPHVLQGFSWIGTSAVAWSLGNFVFTNHDPQKRRSGLLTARFAAAADPHQPPVLTELLFNPMTSDARTLRPRPATAAELRATLAALSKRSEARITRDGAVLRITPRDEPDNAR